MKFGRVKGIRKRVPRLVLGSMVIKVDNRRKSFALLDTARELGWRAIDTAKVYHGGESERKIGEWMEARGCREEIVILGKGAHHSRDRKRCTPFDIASDLFDSLARLRTDYIDLYLLHRDDPDLPVGPIVEALNEHHAAGRIHAFGGSNWTHQRIEEANEYAEKHSLVPFAASSPNLSLANQLESPWGPDCITISGPQNADAREWYRKTRMPVFAWSSLARGFFSGRIKSSDPEGARDALEACSVKSYCFPENFERLRRVEALAKEKRAGVPQIALAYVMAQPLNIFALVGAANRKEMKANLEAIEIKLTKRERQWMNLEIDEL